MSRSKGRRGHFLPESAGHGTRKERALRQALYVGGGLLAVGVVYVAAMPVLALRKLGKKIWDNVPDMPLKAGPDFLNPNETEAERTAREKEVEQLNKDLTRGPNPFL